MAVLDIENQFIGVASLWSATFLYGVNIVMFIICLLILTRGPERRAWFLLGAITLQAILSTAHVTCALGAAVYAFRTTPLTAPLGQLVSAWTSPIGRWINSQQLMLTLNNFVGDLILLWRLYVVYGSSWLVLIVPGCLALAEITCNLYTISTTLVNPTFVLEALGGTRNANFDKVIIAGFTLMATTQFLVTALLAGKIYHDTNPLRKLSRLRVPGSSRPSSGYAPLLWLLVESGAIMAFAQLIWLAVWKQGHRLGGIAEVMLAILGQLCALVPMSIIARVGLRLTIDGSMKSKGGSTSMGTGVSTTMQFTTAARDSRVDPLTATEMRDFRKLEELHEGTE